MSKTRERRWDWLMAGLLFLLLQVSAARLVTTNWAPYLYFAETLAALGTVLGLAMGASRLDRTTLLWLTLAYSVAVVPWQLSEASNAKLLQERLQEVGQVLLTALGQFMARQPVKDSLFFVAFAGLVFWLVCIAAGYWTARHRNILVGIIPTGALVIVIQVYANYQPHSSWWLGVYLFLALLLIGRVYYLEHEKLWLERRVYVHDEAWANILGGLFTVAAGAILLAWLFPTSITSVQAATDAWARMTHGVRDRFSNAVNPLNGPYGRPGTNFYGTSLGIGQYASQGDSPVFTVKVVESPASSLRYYWRARVYDTYENGQWLMSPWTNLNFDPGGGEVTVEDTEHRSEALLRFTLQLPTQNLIYAPSEPVWIDQAAYVQVTPLDNGVNDIISWQTRHYTQTGSRYEVRSQISNPTVKQLREASTVYPEWVMTRYLGVPSSIAPEFKRLAQEVTAGQETPYDKAAAITTYLRQALQYSITVPPPPEGRDPVDWVLFNYKKGFCNYYASAEVLMLRSVGVPARLAVGFAEGEYADGVYTVRRRDAHAWPEVFFPGYGWVEFEPTAIRDPLVRSSGDATGGPAVVSRPLTRPLDDGENRTAHPPMNPGAAAKPAVPFQKTLPGRILLGLLYAAAAAAAVYAFFRYRILTYVPVALTRAFESSGIATPAWILNWLRWTRLEPVERAFAPVNWSLRWLGKPAPLHATAAERASSLEKLLPLAVPHIQAVAGELEKGLFTPEPADVPRARREGWLVLLHAARSRLTRILGL